MNGNELAKHLISLAEQTAEFISNDAPVVMGKTAADFFSDSFQKQGFTNESFEPWQDVKRRTEPHPAFKDLAAASRPILTGPTGDLGMSIQHTPQTGNAQTTVFSDKPYAQAHNEGTDCTGRARTTTIPRRRFIGHSKTLNKLITQELARKLNIIIQKQT